MGSDARYLPGCWRTTSRGQGFIRMNWSNTMNMKTHILTALKEQVDHWESLLAEMNEEQITAPQLPSTWSVKDIIAHLRAWQQRSIARLDAARLNREPEFQVACRS